jgi:hypothetical protein
MSKQLCRRRQTIGKQWRKGCKLQSILMYHHQKVVWWDWQPVSKSADLIVGRRWGK